MLLYMNIFSLGNLIVKKEKKTFREEIGRDIALELQGWMDWECSKRVICLQNLRNL